MNYSENYRSGAVMLPFGFYLGKPIIAKYKLVRGSIGENYECNIWVAQSLISPVIGIITGIRTLYNIRQCDRNDCWGPHNENIGHFQALIVTYNLRRKPIYIFE